MEPKQRKKAGNWGEERVDDYLNQKGWKKIVKNKAFKGAEIDRVYQNHDRVLYAEIKLFTAKSVNKFKELQYEYRLRSFLKPKQIGNLHRFYQFHKKKTHWRIKPFFRLFIVILLSEIIDSKKITQLSHEMESVGFKVCQQSGKLWILSLTPEFTAQGNRSTYLQAEIYQ